MTSGEGRRYRRLAAPCRDGRCVAREQELGSNDAKVNRVVPRRRRRSMINSVLAASRCECYSRELSTCAFRISPSPASITTEVRG
jgi:hypothetical protein